MSIIAESTYDILNRQLLVLANDEVLYHSVSIIGPTATVRSPRLDLGHAMNLISKAGDVSKITRVEVFADSLTASDTVVLPPSCVTISIFAREALISRDTATRIEFTSQALVVNIRTVADGPLQIPLKVVSKGALSAWEKDMAVPFSPDHSGGQLLVRAEDKVQTKLLEPPESYFEFLSLTDQILDDGSLVDLGFNVENDHLPRLLNYQLLLAASLQDSYPSAALQLAKFVAQQTRDVAKALDLYSQASAIATVQVVRSGSMAMGTVPNIDLGAAQQVLQSRLQSAMSFETALMSYVEQKDSAENIRTLASITLQASQDADRTYAVIAAMNQSRYDNAIKALGIAQEHFQELQMTMVARRDAFTAGVEKWKKIQIGKAVGEAVIGVAVVVGSIAAAVVFPPAAAGAVAGGGAAIGAVGAAGAEVAATVSVIGRIVETLKKLFETLKPGLEKIDKLVTALQTTLALLKNMGAVNEATEDEGMPSLKLGDDEINIAADWDVFGAEMQQLHDAIKEFDIDGASDYFLMLADMVIRAKAVLAAQTAVAVTGDALIITTTQKLASERQTKRLEQAIAKIQGNPRAFQIFKLSMLDRLMSIRYWITLDFKRYLAALEWYSLRKSTVIRVDPMKQIQEFVNDAALLQAEVARQGADIRPQTRLFRASTKDTASISPLIIGEDWLNRLRSDQAVIFKIDVAHSVFAKMARVRLLHFRLYLEGAKTSPASSSLSLTARLGSEVLDLAPRIEGSSGTPLITSSRAVGYLMDEHTLMYEYIPDTGEVLVDGGLATSFNGLRSSPFRTWHVTVEPGADLSGVVGIRFEMGCEFNLVV